MGSKDKATWKKDFENLMKAEGNLDYGLREETEKELYGDNDRAVAIMNAYILEDNLKAYIQAQIPPSIETEFISSLFKAEEGVLGSLGAKANIAYAFGLIGSVCRDDIKLVRMLRNAFAHSKITFNFETPAIKGVCDRLAIPDIPSSYIPPDYLRQQRGRASEFEYANSMKSPKTRYIVTCIGISYRMFMTKNEYSSDREIPVSRFLP